MNRLEELVTLFLQGTLATEEFCQKFEHAYNFEVTDSDARLPYAKLFDVVVWYTPLEDERARVPNYTSEEEVRLAAVQAARGIAT